MKQNRTFTLLIGVMVLGMCLASPVLAQQPKQFFLDFVDAYLVYQPSTGTLQIATELMVLSYGGDWERKQLKPYLYHMRLKTWQGFYWKINTSRKEAYKVVGTFGTMGGTETALKMGVRVVY